MQKLFKDLPIGHIFIRMAEPKNGKWLKVKSFLYRNGFPPNSNTVGVYRIEENKCFFHQSIRTLPDDDVVEDCGKMGKLQLASFTYY